MARIPEEETEGSGGVHVTALDSNALDLFVSNTTPIHAIGVSGVDRSNDAAMR